MQQTAGRDQARKDQADHLYEQYGKPLEVQHAGRYVAIAPDGRTLVAPTVLEALRGARAAFGPGSFIFKVGERAVGRWR
jgi:hypothetical protein